MPHPVPRSAYIHVPFCAHRCGYCNFTLVAGRDDLVEPYLAALERELSWLESPRELDTLYIGGGTPTELRGQRLRRFLSLVLAWHPLGRAHECTAEANPRDIDPGTAAILADHGVTRVSLGAQSFHSGKLQALERRHTRADIERAAKVIRQRGMDLSLDLIFAAPGETLDQWRDDLDLAIAVAPDHVSTYALTFERGARFWSRRRRGELHAADEELERAMYEEAIVRLGAAGFEHYEVSNFAQIGKRCRHNEAYWLGEEYYAAGPGAARYVNRVRSINHRSTTAYIRRVLAAKSPVAESERLSPPELAVEVLVFALRRREGVSRAWFSRKTGMPLETVAGDWLREGVFLGLLDDDGGHIRLTHEGLMLSDAVFRRLLAFPSRTP